MDSNRDPPRPPAVDWESAAEHTSGDELTHNPAEIDVRCEVWTEDDGGDVGGVGDSQGLEDTEGNTHEDRTGADHTNSSGVGEEMDEVEAGTGDDRNIHRPLVAKPLRQVTIDVETNDGTDLSTVLNTSLPCGGDPWVALRIKLGAELLTESVETQQATDGRQVVAVNHETLNCKPRGECLRTLP